MPRLSTFALQLLTQQQNVIAPWQVDRPSAGQMHRWHTEGLWRQLTRFAYLAAPCPPTPEQMRWAAVLHVGSHGLLSGQTALVCDGWTGREAGPIEVLAPSSTNSRSGPSWMRVHRTSLAHAAARRGIPRVLPAAAAVDAAGWARTDREAMFVVVSVLQQRLCRPQEIEAVLRDRPSAKRRALILDTVQEFRGGATSMGEIDFGAVCKRYGIRKPDRQIRRRDAHGVFRYIDAYFDAENVTVEIDGLHHVEVEVWMDDHERQNDLVIDGHRTFLRVSTWVLKYDPDIFMAQLGRALGKG